MPIGVDAGEPPLWKPTPHAQRTTTAVDGGSPVNVRLTYIVGLGPGAPPSLKRQRSACAPSYLAPGANALPAPSLTTSNEEAPDVFTWVVGHVSTSGVRPLASVPVPVALLLKPSKGSKAIGVSVVTPTQSMRATLLRLTPLPTARASARADHHTPVAHLFTHAIVVGELRRVARIEFVALPDDDGAAGERGHRGLTRRLLPACARATAAAAATTTAAGPADHAA